MTHLQSLFCENSYLHKISILLNEASLWEQKGTILGLITLRRSPKNNQSRIDLIFEGKVLK